MALSLQPYRLQKIDELSYGFTTKNGVEYRCSFLSFASYLINYPDVAPYFFSFNLDLKNKNEKLPRGTDKRIADTIVTTVGDFLTSRTNVVVYVCDNSDGKESARSRKFLSWFVYFDHSSSDIIQISNNFNAGEMLFYSCLLVHKQNKRFTEIILAYLELTREEDK